MEQKPYDVFDLLRELQGRNYLMPMRLSLLMEKIPKSDTTVGEGIINELELDRRNVFRAIYGDFWVPYMQAADSFYIFEEDTAKTTIHYLMRDLEEKRL